MTEWDVNAIGLSGDSELGTKTEGRPFTPTTVTEWWVLTEHLMDTD